MNTHLLGLGLPHTVILGPLHFFMFCLALSNCLSEVAQQEATPFRDKDQVLQIGEAKIQEGMMMGLYPPRLEMGPGSHVVG